MSISGCTGATRVQVPPRVVVDVVLMEVMATLHVSVTKYVQILVATRRPTVRLHATSVRDVSVHFRTVQVRYMFKGEVRLMVGQGSATVSTSKTTSTNAFVRCLGKSKGG